MTCDLKICDSVTVTSDTVTQTRHVTCVNHVTCFPALKLTVYSTLLNLKFKFAVCILLIAEFFVYDSSY